MTEVGRAKCPALRIEFRALMRNLPISRHAGDGAPDGVSLERPSRCWAAAFVR